MLPCVAEVGTPWVPDAPEDVLPVVTVDVPAPGGVAKVTLLAARAVRPVVVDVLFLAAGGLAGGGGAEG